jgi:hypothetical protein
MCQIHHIRSGVWKLDIGLLDAGFRGRETNEFSVDAWTPVESAFSLRRKGKAEKYGMKSSDLT